MLSWWLGLRVEVKRFRGAGFVVWGQARGAFQGGTHVTTQIVGDTLLFKSS